MSIESPISKLKLPICVRINKNEQKLLNKVNKDKNEKYLQRENYQRSCLSDKGLVPLETPKYTYLHRFGPTATAVSTAVQKLFQKHSKPIPITVLADSEARDALTIRVKQILQALGNKVISKQNVFSKLFDINKRYPMNYEGLEPSSIAKNGSFLLSKEEAERASEYASSKTKQVMNTLGILPEASGRSSVMVKLDPLLKEGLGTYHQRDIISYPLSPEEKLGVTHGQNFWSQLLPGWHNKVVKRWSKEHQPESIFITGPTEQHEQIPIFSPAAKKTMFVPSPEFYFKQENCLPAEDINRSIEQDTENASEINGFRMEVPIVKSWAFKKK